MIRTSTALCLAALACAPALAQDARSTLDFGVNYRYQGDATSDGLNATPAQASWEAGDVTAVMLNYEYRPMANVGLQLAASFGGSFTVSGAGSLAALGSLFKATPYSATLFLNYHFFDAANALRPFLGIGVNYTGFSSISSYTGQNVEMDSGWGVAVQAGARYAIDRNWSVLLSLGTNWTKSDVTLSGGTGGTQQAALDFRPVIFGLGVGYSF